MIDGGGPDPRDAAAIDPVGDADSGGERDAAVERWLREEVAAGHAEYLADPSKGVPAEEILDRIQARRASQAP
jgi:hypothetical protein